MNVTTVVEDGERLPAVFANWLEARASRVTTGAFSLAVPGGSVAERLLPALERRVFASADLHVFWVDERAVALDDPASNYGLAKRIWLDPVGVPDHQVHPMRAEASLDAAVRASELELLGVLGRPPRLDVALLGVGEDGHVASLFPEHPVLRATGWVSSLSDSPKPPARRLTLTLNTLWQARTVVIAAFGSNKASVIAEALRSRDSQLPVVRVMRRAPECALFLDRAAAGELALA